MTPPYVVPPPQNVRARTHAGDEIPLDVVYVGRDDDGLAVWRAELPPYVLLDDVAGITVEVLPARTAVEVGRA